MRNHKLYTLLLGAALTISTTACGSKDDTKENAAAPTAAPSAAAAASAQPEHSPAAAAGHAVHWSYTGDTGPAHWGELDPANSACANGSEQSPIDIDIAHVKANQELKDVVITYKPAAFTLINNGHTIQANAAADSANTIQVEGKAYKLAQLHFHLPSEHKFDGKSFDMELHLVHKSESGELAVLGVMLKAGKEQAALSEIWSKLPKEETKEALKLDNPIDLNALLPADKATFRYNGSLTTPPCSQSVKWVVLEQPMEVSKEQVEAFGKLFPNNARPVQDLKSRSVETDK